MSKKAGVVLVIAGTVMVLSALFLLLHNRYEDVSAGQRAESLLSGVQSVISENKEKKEANPAEKKTHSTEMPTAEIDGYEYIGYLSVPALALNLPVMSEWDYSRLKIAPCRQCGSSVTDDLVIAAHNYKAHFGYLGQLKIGSPVVFTDMEGTANNYEVKAIDVLTPESVERVQNSGYDLVLYTCTRGGKSRITVFCSRKA